MKMVMTARRGQLKRNLLSLFVEHGANYVLPIITIPYLLRVLGSGNFGRLAFSQALISYFSILSEYGFNLSATKRVAAIGDDPEQLSRFSLSVFLIKFILMLVCFIIMLAIVWFIPALHTDMTLYIASFLSVIGGVIFPTWLFQGLERMSQIVITSLLARAVTVAAIFAFVRRPEDYRLAAGIQASSTVISGLATSFLLPTLVFRHSCKIPSWADIKQTLSDGWHLFVSNVSVTLYTNSNVFVLGLLATPGIVGQFSAAEKLVKATVSLFSPVSQAVYPHIARQSEESSDDALKITRRLLLLQGSFTLAVSTGLLLWARPIILVIFGNSFSSSIILVQMMAFLPFIIGVSNVLGIHMMLNFGLTRAFSRIAISLGLINITLLFILVPRLQAIGAAMSAVLSEVVVTLAMALVVWRAGLLKRLLFHSSGRS
jgi:PST family polysaccharide transporter